MWVPEETFYYLLGFYILEGKRKEGRQLHIRNEVLFCLFVGFFVYHHYVNPNFEPESISD